MKRYTLDENRGDIIYEVDGDMLILRISPHFVSSISHDNYYMIKTGDDTVASDYNVFSAKRTLEEIGRSGKQYWKIVGDVLKIFVIMSCVFEKRPIKVVWENFSAKFIVIVCVPIFFVTR